MTPPATVSVRQKTGTEDVLGSNKQLLGKTKSRLKAFLFIIVWSRTGMATLLWDAFVDRSTNNSAMFKRAPKGALTALLKHATRRWQCYHERLITSPGSFWPFHAMLHLKSSLQVRGTVICLLRQTPGSCLQPGMESLVVVDRGQHSFTHFSVELSASTSWESLFWESCCLHLLVLLWRVLTACVRHWGTCLWSAKCEKPVCQTQGGVCG